MPNAFCVATMRTTDGRNAEVETANQQWIAARSAFHTTFTALDEAYQKSLMSLTTKSVAEKDDERDVYGQVLEQVAKQWARLPDDALAIHECSGSQSTNAFINSYRVDHAARMLANTDEPVALIAEMSGFANRTTFNEQFRNLYKMTPSEYRRAAKA